MGERPPTQGQRADDPRLLERLGEITANHRDVATSQELERYLSIWVQKRYADYPVLYLATHGDRGVLWSSFDRDANMTLAELADTLGDRARGRYVYLGSCSTLLDGKAAQDFVTSTGVAALMGYRRQIDWVETAAFEVILLRRLANLLRGPKTFSKSLIGRHSELSCLFGFTMVTKDGEYQSPHLAPRPATT